MTVVDAVIGYCGIVVMVEVVTVLVRMAFVVVVGLQ